MGIFVVKPHANKLSESESPFGVNQNIVNIRQSASLHQMGSSFPFEKLRCRFSKPEREGISRTGSWILINWILKLNMDLGILNLIVMNA